MENITGSSRLLHLHPGKKLSMRKIAVSDRPHDWEKTSADLFDEMHLSKSSYIQFQTHQEKP